MKHLYYNKSSRFAQGAAALMAGAVLLGGALWPRAEAVEDEPEQVGSLVVAGRAPQTEEPRHPVLTFRASDPVRCVGIEAPEEDGPSQPPAAAALPEGESQGAEAREEEGPSQSLRDSSPHRGSQGAEAREEAAPWWTEEELELLACTIYCEAGSDSISDETRLMVGQVVINRVNSPDYPGTIEEVLTQRGQYGRFFWTGVVWPSRAGRSVEAHAVERAYDCAERVLGGEWLLPTDVIYQAGFVQGREVVAQAPGFYFCR